MFDDIKEYLIYYLVSVIGCLLILGIFIKYGEPKELGMLQVMKGLSLIPFLNGGLLMILVGCIGVAGIIKLAMIIGSVI